MSTPRLESGLDPVVPGHGETHTTRPSALLWIGSPRRRSNSTSLGGYLLDGLASRGWATRTLSMWVALKTPQDTQAMLAALDEADVIVLAFPLYADSLPSHAVQAMELLAARRPSREAPKPQRLVAIVNCGFPESSQCATALAICRQFAEETGITWAGGLALGGGPLLDRRPLKEAGGVARNAMQALDLAAAALAEGQDVPAAAAKLMRRPLRPAWVYILTANLGWLRWGRKFGTLGELRDRPYARRPETRSPSR